MDSDLFSKLQVIMMTMIKNKQCNSTVCCLVRKQHMRQNYEPMDVDYMQAHICNEEGCALSSAWLCIFCVKAEKGVSNYSAQK